MRSRLRGGVEPPHGYNLRRTLSTEFVSLGHREGLTDSQEELLQSPDFDEEADGSAVQDPMTLYQSLLRVSFDDLMSFYSSEKPQEEIGLFHLAVGTGFDKTFKAVSAGLSKSLKKDVGQITGECAFKAYHKAYQLLARRKGYELFAAYAAFGCGHMTATNRTYFGIGLGFQELFSVAEGYFNESLSLTPELFINHFYLARIYTVNKSFNEANRESENFLRQVRCYKELNGPRAGLSEEHDEEVEGQRGEDFLPPSSRVGPAVSRGGPLLQSHLKEVRNFLKKIQAPAKASRQIESDFSDLFQFFE